LWLRRRRRLLLLLLWQRGCRHVASGPPTPLCWCSRRLRVCVHGCWRQGGRGELVARSSGASCGGLGLLLLLLLLLPLLLLVPLRPP
jgi:hypothetical protein